MTFWAAGASAVATIGSAAYAANAAGKAADASASGANQASQLSNSQFQQTQANLAPWRTTGASALSQLGSLFGLQTSTPEQFAGAQPVTVGDSQLPPGTQLQPAGNGWYDVTLNGQNLGVLRPGGANGRFVSNGTPIPATSAGPSAATGATPAGAPNMNAFTASPGYDFRRTEGMRGIERTAAARGGAFSGNALRALTDFNSNLASGEFGNYVNQLSNIAGLGQNATNATGTFGQNAANTQGQNALYAGNARASGIENQGNIYGQAINGLGNIAGYYGQNKSPQPYGGTGYGSGQIPYGTPPYAPRNA